MRVGHSSVSPWGISVDGEKYGSVAQFRKTPRQTRPFDPWPLYNSLRWGDAVGAEISPMTVTERTEIKWIGWQIWSFPTGHRALGFGRIDHWPDCNACDTACTRAA
jgi:hypothetical protein